MRNGTASNFGPVTGVMFHLKKHLKIHLGEKIYICNQCPKAFYQNVLLQKHLKMLSFKIIDSS